MGCKVTKFMEGSTNYKPSAIKDHETSELHLRAVRAQTPIESSSAAKALSQLTQKQEDQMQLLFKVVHACVKKHKSFKDYVWICDLVDSMEKDIGPNYRTDKQAKVFMSCIADGARKKN